MQKKEAYRKRLLIGFEYLDGIGMRWNLANFEKVRNMFSPQENKTGLHIEFLLFFCWFYR